jgi:hypothetical protein
VLQYVPKKEMDSEYYDYRADLCKERIDGL